MTPLELMRRANAHMRAAVVTEPGPRQDEIAGKAEALQLWAVGGALSGLLCATIAAVGVYYLAASVGALCALIPGLWESTESDLRRTAAHDLVVAVPYLAGAVWTWRLTLRVLTAMAHSIEGDGADV